MHTEKSSGSLEMMNLNARYYEPESGRFITQDTYRGGSNEPDTWHLYAYCANDPINYVNPSGHAAIVWAGGYYAVAVSAAVIGAMFSIGPAGWITITAIVLQSYAYGDSN